MKIIDIAIIGGGIIGTMIAREIMKNTPALSLTIIEQKMLGQGASWYSAGAHFPRGNSARVRNMSLYSHDDYQQLMSQGMPLFPLPMTLLTTAKNSHINKQTYLPLTQLQPVAELSGECADIKLPVGMEIYHGQGCHYSNVVGLINALISNMRSSVRIREGVSVEHLIKNKGYQITLSSGETLQARQVILAPGPWLEHPAWRHELTDLRLRIKKIVAVHIDLVPSAEERLTIFHDEDAFLLPCHQRGHWLFSYTCNDWDVDPQSIGSLQAQDLAGARTILSKYSPRLAQHISDGRIFCDAYSEQREPIITRLNESLVFAGAANGSGYRLAPAIASEVVNLL